MSHQTAPIRFRRASTITLGWNNLLRLSAALMDPLALAGSLWAVAIYMYGKITPDYLVLAILVISLTLPGNARLHFSIWRLASSVLLSWTVICLILLGFGFASGYVYLFDRQAIVLWLGLAPLTQFGMHLALRSLAPSLVSIQGEPKRAVIVGVNEQGLKLAQAITQNPYIPTQLNGFFDDRVRERVGLLTEFALLGPLAHLPQYVHKHHIEAIYLSLPMATEPRMMKLLDVLCDSTVSIYFVPNMFVTNLMQGRMDSVGEVPVITVCETPFTGVNGMIKRGSDLVLASLILLMIAPILLIIGLAIALTSPGPVIFRQRRYGLNGEEILVSKFRTMTVCENGDSVQQARKDDDRVTPIGAFLRKTSLDELPQFFDVLKGHMSIVGPRPHAVAHNELYRSMIKGYMVRHKVKPGITGWAQVNGWRGETDTLDKMKHRIDYDLAYLQNWSLQLDLYIILKTVRVVLKDRHAY